MPKMSETQIQSPGGEDPLEEEMGNPFQYSCLENPMDRGAWRSIVHGVTKSRIWLKRLSMHIHYFKKLGSISFWCGAATKIAYATKNIFYDPLRSTNIWVPSSGLNCPLHITSFKALASKGPSNWGLCIRWQTWPWMQSPLSLNTLPGNMWAVAPGTLVWLASCFG